MKKTLTFLTVCLFVVIASASYAQKIKLVSGDVAVLKGQKIINVQYDYAGVTVGDKNEDEYIKEKVAKYNKDEAGKGDKWKEAWFNDRKARYQPKFEELMNEYLNKEGITVGQEKTDAKYTIIIKSIDIEPGYNIGISRKPAFINVEISIVETATPDKSLAKITMTNVPGAAAMGYDFDSGLRISEGYAKCGKELAKYIIKNALK